jgi:hypothetical protein
MRVGTHVKCGLATEFGTMQILSGHRKERRLLNLSTAMFYDKANAALTHFRR